MPPCSSKSSRAGRQTVAFLLEPDFWTVFPQHARVGIARFVNCQERHPYIGPMVIGGSGKQPPADRGRSQEQQRTDLERSLEYARRCWRRRAVAGMTCAILSKAFVWRIAMKINVSLGLAFLFVALRWRPIPFSRSTSSSVFGRAPLPRNTAERAHP